MKFRFNFENILKTKKIERDAAQRDFIYAREVLDSEVANLGGMQNQVEDTRNINMASVSRKQLSSEDLAVLQWADSFMEVQRIRMARQRQVVGETNADYEEKREYLSQAAKNYKIFEKLKEKMKEKFKKDQRKLERKSIDELVVMYTKRGQR